MAVFNSGVTDSLRPAVLSGRASIGVRDFIRLASSIQWGRGLALAGTLNYINQYGAGVGRTCRACRW